VQEWGWAPDEAEEGEGKEACRTGEGWRGVTVTGGTPDGRSDVQEGRRRDGAAEAEGECGGLAGGCGGGYGECEATHVRCKRRW
jgi:hypothetical protein